MTVKSKEKFLKTLLDNKQVEITNIITSVNNPTCYIPAKECGCLWLISSIQRINVNEKGLMQFCHMKCSANCFEEAFDIMSGIYVVKNQLGNMFVLNI